MIYSIFFQKNLIITLNWICTYLDNKNFRNYELMHKNKYKDYTKKLSQTLSGSFLVVKANILKSKRFYNYFLHLEDADFVRKFQVWINCSLPKRKTMHKWNRGSKINIPNLPCY